MLDALCPAVEAIAAHADDDMLVGLQAAESAAQVGMESTKNYVAKFGRCKISYGAQYRLSGCRCYFSLADF